MNAKNFNELMIRAGRQMMIAALRVTESEADAADAVQEAMIRLWQKSADLAKAENPVAYAATAARRCALDIVRSRHAAEPIDDVRWLSDRRDPIEERDSLKLALKLIEALPSPAREVMTLRHLEGLEISEIQEKLNLSAANVRVILSRGRSALRKHFEI
ncbi:MAG: sigma-70 family RNA polymerase sigma factor [Muribaculaceae bacterium]|nr:sigma-70 family RNA polymerase sigma factor [Muribaculaceae bacterium]